MSVHLIYYQQGHKMMEAVATEEAYRRYRDSQTQARLMEAIRHPKPETDISAAKRKLVQFNYSCLPTEDGGLKGAKRLSKSVGMDIDHLSADEVELVAATAIDKKDELGLLMLERSARGGGLHLVFRRHPEMDQEANLRWASDLLGVEYDAGAKDITRVFFATTSEDLLYLHEDLFDNGEYESFTGSEATFAGSKNTFTNKEATSTGSEATSANKEAASTASEATSETEADQAQPAAATASETTAASRPANHPLEAGEDAKEQKDEKGEKTASEEKPLCYKGIPYDRIIEKWWAFYNEGEHPIRSNRNTLTFELAVNLRHICDSDPLLLDRIIPCYDGFPEAEKMACIRSALGEKMTQMPRRLKDVLTAVRQDMRAEPREEDDEETITQDDLQYYDALPKMPQGVRESISAVGPHLAMPAIFAITPAIGMLATGVRVLIHGKPSQLNLISYIAGDFASGKGSLDPIVAAWLAEVKMVDKGYLEAEEEWRARKRAAKNKKEQPEDPKYPVRWLTLNTTVANLADRLANTCGKHAFSFTPEADTVSQKWRTAMSDFSVMLRQAYDGTPYDREAKSAEAVNVHIDKLLWNVVMCGTPDALYRVITNYTDGFQSRVALARTPDNTFSPLSESLFLLTESQQMKIQQVAHLLPLMSGDVDLPKLEKKGRDWLERIRIETLKSYDKTKARQRFRTCPTAMRMMTCLMLCRVAEQMIQSYGEQGAETRLKAEPELWKTLLQRQQTPQMLAAFDVLADYMIDNAMLFFRERIETHFDRAPMSRRGRHAPARARTTPSMRNWPTDLPPKRPMESPSASGAAISRMAACAPCSADGSSREWSRGSKEGFTRNLTMGRCSHPSPVIASNRYIVTLLHVTCYVKEIPTSHFCCLGLCQIIRTIIKNIKTTIIKTIIIKTIKTNDHHQKHQKQNIKRRTKPCHLYCQNTSASRSLPPPSSPSRGA